MNAKQKMIVACFILSIFLGMTFKVLLNSPIQGNRNSFVSREIVSQINLEKSELKKDEALVESPTNEYKKLQKKNKVDENVLSTEEAKKLKYYRMLVGHEMIQGEGVIITLEGKKANQNIAFVFDKDRLLLKLINIAKRKGGEVVAVNNQLILPQTGVVLAGNHININNVPITPPYEIKIIGNEKSLYRHFTEDSVFLLTLENKYEIATHVEKNRKIQIPKALLQRELEYIKEEQ